VYGIKYMLLNPQNKLSSLHDLSHGSITLYIFFNWEPEFPFIENIPFLWQQGRWRQPNTWPALPLSYRNNMSNAALAFIEMEHILNEWEFW